jgi:hypothetical protein
MLWAFLLGVILGGSRVVMQVLKGFNMFWVAIILEVHMNGSFFVRVDPTHYVTEANCRSAAAALVDGDGGEQFICAPVDQMPKLSNKAEKIQPSIITPAMDDRCWNPDWCNTTTCIAKPGEYRFCIRTVDGCVRPPSCP